MFLPGSDLRTPLWSVSEPSDEARLEVRLAAAVRLRIAVALELVAGQTWAHLQPGRDRGTHCPGGTVHTERVRGTAPAANRLSPHARPGRLGASAQADSEPVLRISASAIL
jgi:hypothetical protein